MTILRRAFGFSPDTEDEEGEYDPVVPTYAVSNQNSAVSDSTASPAVADEGQQPCDAEASESAVQSASKSVSDETLPADIFDAVIEIFNQAQPDFVRECLNVEAQRQYILNSLSESLRGRVSTALTSGNRDWEIERELLEKRIAELEGDDNEITALRKENKRLKLSNDCQKRALLDRINDLEARLARQAEENERFYSRKRTPDSEELVKANARVKELEEQATRFTAEIEELKKTPDQAPAETAGDEALKVEIESLKTLLDGHKSEAEKQHEELNRLRAEWDGEKSQLVAERDALKEEVGRQTVLKEQLEMKTSMSDVMINDLRNQAASARAELEKQQKEQELVMEQIKEQLDGFEDLKARKDAKISELQEANTSLRRTIETNLYNQANSEMKLRREIKDLKAELAKCSATAGGGDTATGSVRPAAAPAVSPAVHDPVKAEKPKSRRGRPKKVRIDNELDNTDWFAGAKHDDPDFGYHEPPRKPVNDNEAQLSLF